MTIITSTQCYNHNLGDYEAIDVNHFVAKEHTKAAEVVVERINLYKATVNSSNIEQQEFGVGDIVRFNRSKLEKIKNDNKIIYDRLNLDNVDEIYTVFKIRILVKKNGSQ